MADAALTWLGHASFRVDTPRGKRVYVDPWLEGNPKCPEAELEPERCDLIAVTHGHGDHVGSVPALARRFDAQVLAMNELADWLSGQGVENATGFNKGGTVEVDGTRVTMTHALHSSGAADGTYTGEAAGLVVELEGAPTLYFAGDTCAFLDMQLIGRLHAPEIAVLPIGDHFTMGPREAAVALELLGSPRCIPCHYGTFPVLVGTPEELRRHARDVEILELAPGETIAL